MSKLLSIVAQTQRSYSLQFHKHEAISTKSKVFWFAVSIAVFPACLWAFNFMNRSKEKRLKREEEFGKPFFKPIPRVMRPLPWGDGQTAFFTTMKKYWGFKDHDSH